MDVKNLKSNSGSAVIVIKDSGDWDQDEVCLAKFVPI